MVVNSRVPMIFSIVITHWHLLSHRLPRLGFRDCHYLYRFLNSTNRMSPSLDVVKIDNDHKIGLLLSQVDTFLLDCDGVIWSGSRGIKGAKEFYSLLVSEVVSTCDILVGEVLITLAKKGKDVIFLTNNSTKSRASYVKKLSDFGILTTQDRVVSASYIASNYIKNILKLSEDKSVYCIGMDGIKEELDLVGVKCAGIDEDDVVENISDLNELHPDPSVGAVLVGLDLKMNYMKFAKAHLYLTADPNLPYLVTNTDPTLPSTSYSFPGAGALVAMLNTSLKNRTPTVLGKPTKFAYQTLEQWFACLSYNYQFLAPTNTRTYYEKISFKLNPRRTCMIGDRLTTDVTFGVENGLLTVLVLSGASNIENLKNSTVKPMFYANSLADLVPQKLNDK